MTSLKEQIRSIERAIKKHEKENKGKHFTSITPDEIERTLKLANNPWISGYGWDDSTPGGKINLSVGINNPGTSQVHNLYVHIWVGSGITDPSGDTFLLNVDTRFPRLTQPGFPGGTVDPLSTKDFNFVLDIPTKLRERTTFYACA
jgi:hypothetical protein